MTMRKDASVETVQPGATFTYTLTVGCTTFGAGCVDATITDPVPAEFLIQGTPTVSGAPADVAVDGQDVTVTFTSDLGDDGTGMLAAATAEIEISVRADPDLPYSANGVPVTNTGTVDSENSDPAEDDAVVTPEVPLELAATATKTITPERAVAEPGAPLTATLGAANASNAEVEYLRITDPPDPAAAPNPFEYIAFSGFGTVTFPDGADQVQVDAWDGAQWVDGTPGPEAVLPDGVANDAVRGLRFTFTDSSGGILPADAAAEVELDLVQRDNVADLTAETTVTDTIESEVARDGQTATSDPASDTYVIHPPEISTEAGKSFSPDTVAAGDPSTATVTGTNTGTPVDSMVITEPDPAADPNPFEDGLTFTGFTDGVVWPNGATTASITYTYADGTTETLTTTQADTLPHPATGRPSPASASSSPARSASAPRRRSPSPSTPTPARPPTRSCTATRSSSTSPTTPVPPRPPPTPT